MAAILDNHSCPDLFTYHIRIAWIRVMVFIICFKTADGFLGRALALANIPGFRDCSSGQRLAIHSRGLYRFIPVVSLFTAPRVIVPLLLRESYIPTLTLSRYTQLKVRMASIGI